MKISNIHCAINWMRFYDEEKGIEIIATPNKNDYFIGGSIIYLFIVIKLYIKTSAYFIFMSDASNI